MIVKCVSCGNEIQIQDGMAPGQNFVCPYCHTKLAYWGRTRITRVLNKKEKTSIGPKVALGLLGVSVIVGLFVYKNRLDAQRAQEFRLAEEQRAREEARAQKMEEERLAMEEADRKRRAEQKEKEEAERAKRREENAKREAEREKQRQEAQDRAESERRMRELIEGARNGFAGAPSVIAADFPEEQSPLSYKTNGRFFAVDLKCVSEQKMYEIIVEDGKLSKVRSLSRKGGELDVSPAEFKELTDGSIVFVRGDSGPVWICGKVKSRMNVPVPEIGSGLSPIAIFLGDGYAAMQSLRTVAPEIKFRITLQTGQGNGDVSLGVFKAEESISAESVRSKVRDRLTEEKLKKAGSGLTPPKMKKVKRTVVFYEGERVFKAMNGVTKVPRTFKFFGTSRSNDNKAHVQDIIERAKAQWEALCEEARRQERRELEVEEENRRAKEEYQRRVDAAMRNARAGSDDVDAELKKFKLLIERSKSKLMPELKGRDE